jgi:tRNA (cmo5U34)-methyltransferase
MELLDDYNRIAPYYDRLAKLVFRDEIIRSQVHFLKDIPRNSKVLIIGGGTGWILPEVLDAAPDCRIWYVEASSEMIRLARQKVSASAEVDFIHGTDKSLPERVAFDFAITNFVLDSFSENAIQRLGYQLRTQLTPMGRWLVVDFVPSPKTKHRFLLWLMYRFFRVATSLPQGSLPNWQAAVGQSGFIPVKRSVFSSGFIESILFGPIT